MHGLYCSALASESLQQVKPQNRTLIAEPPHPTITCHRLSPLQDGESVIVATIAQCNATTSDGPNPQYREGIGLKNWFLLLSLKK